MQGFVFCNWNELNLNPLTSINWRASLVPAAAVIPAPIAYIKVVAVKTLVVELLLYELGGFRTCSLFHGIILIHSVTLPLLMVSEILL